MAESKKPSYFSEFRNFEKIKKKRYAQASKRHNETCGCGSGQKYGKCCGKIMFD